MSRKKNIDLRFEFGKNWQLFLSSLSKNKIETAKRSLISLLNVQDLSNKKFLDIGSGSGLFSLSANSLGAEVMSFDYDEFSVEATKYVKNKYSSNDNYWQIEKGDILDSSYLKSLGKYDFVYSWGVLHHTGDMYQALENASICVNDNGCLIIAIYNTQITTPIWKIIKKYYVSSPLLIQKILSYLFMIYFSLGLFFADLIRFRNPFLRYSSSTRGMNAYTDVIDWIGGYPFETARPDEIISFYMKKGFSLENIRTVGGNMGCNEFVFRKI